MGVNVYSSDFDFLKFIWRMQVCWSFTTFTLNRRRSNESLGHENSILSIDILKTEYSDISETNGPFDTFWETRGLLNIRVFHSDR